MTHKRLLRNMEDVRHLSVEFERSGTANYATSIAPEKFPAVVVWTETDWAGTSYSYAAQAEGDYVYPEDFEDQKI